MRLAVTTNGRGINVDGAAAGSITGNTIGFISVAQGGTAGRTAIRLRDSTQVIVSGCRLIGSVSYGGTDPACTVTRSSVKTWLFGVIRLTALEQRRAAAGI